MDWRFGTLQNDENEGMGTIAAFMAILELDGERNYSRLYQRYDAEYRGNGIHPKLSHYASRLRAAYEIGGISMIFRRLFID